MVNQAFASRFFPERGPIGRRFQLNAARYASHEIVGVVKDAHFRDPRADVTPTVFVPMLQDQSGRIFDCEFEVRTRGGAESFAPAIREAIAEVDARVTVSRTNALRSQVLSTFGPERIAARFIVTFAALALLVASVGLYGLVSHGLARRTNEIGIRMALGATRPAVAGLIARETLVRLALGLSIGLALAWLGGPVLAHQLFGVAPGDMVSAGLSAAVLTVVVALATLRPTLRALRVDPVSALRAE
jgi:predicted lysophospholipase L1 biosynthesis ABC-type transport system permease subunit